MCHGFESHLSSFGKRVVSEVVVLCCTCILHCFVVSLYMYIVYHGTCKLYYELHVYCTCTCTCTCIHMYTIHVLCTLQESGDGRGVSSPPLPEELTPGHTPVMAAGDRVRNACITSSSVWHVWNTDDVAKIGLYTHACTVHCTCTSIIKY